MFWSFFYYTKSCIIIPIHYRHFHFSSRVVLYRFAYFLSVCYLLFQFTMFLIHRTERATQPLLHCDIIESIIFQSIEFSSRKYIAFMLRWPNFWGEVEKFGIPKFFRIPNPRAQFFGIYTQGFAPHFGNPQIFEFNSKIDPIFGFQPENFHKI